MSDRYMNKQPGPDRNGGQKTEPGEERRRSGPLTFRPDDGQPGVELTVRRAAPPPVQAAVPLPSSPESDLWKYARVLRRRWVTIAATFAVIVIGTGIGIALTPR